MTNLMAGDELVWADQALIFGSLRLRRVFSAVAAKAALRALPLEKVRMRLLCVPDLQDVALSSCLDGCQCQLSVAGR